MPRSAKVCGVRVENGNVAHGAMDAAHRPAIPLGAKDERCIKRRGGRVDNRHVWKDALNLRLAYLGKPVANRVAKSAACSGEGVEMRVRKNALGNLDDEFSWERIHSGIHLSARTACVYK